MESEVGAIDTLISSILPNLHEDKKRLLTEHMKSLGVETMDDFQYLQESDLISVLRPIEARKMIGHFKTCEGKKRTSDWENGFTSPGSSRTPAESSPVSFSCDNSSSSSSTSTPTRKRVDSDWHYNFDIPWNKLHSEVSNKLQQAERPTARERREIIRLVVAEILTVCPKPNKKHLNEIARKMVLTYPKSFQDVIHGEVVGSGYDSITKQLICRMENYKRLGCSYLPKNASTNDPEQPPFKRKKKDSYGCINWQPTKMPATETPESQARHKQDLQNMFNERKYNLNIAAEKMTTTYFSQRQDILKGMSTSSLLNEWPFLFDVDGVKIHFKELTGVELSKDFETNLKTKCERVFEYMRATSKDRKGKIKEVVSAVEKSGSKTAASILMLLEHFNEDETKMFHYVDATCLPEEVSLKELPSGPCIIVCGTTIFVSPCFMVAVDGVIVNSALRSFTDALILMFALFYCMNIDYSSELSATMEFLQRCIFHINPDKGTKVEQNKKKKQCATNPKVLSLITNLADFEWTVK